MKISSNVGLLAVIVIITFADCNKGDSTSANSLSTTIVNDVTATDLSNCKMRRMYQRPEGSESEYSNSKGLPLSLSPSNDVFFGGFIGATKIIYDCL